jgi:hypothetical protein
MEIRFILKYITFLVYNTKISDNNAESGKMPRMLVAFPCRIARKILSKRNFKSPCSAISQFPMTLMKSMASLHQGPKVSKAKPLNTKFDEIIEPYLLCFRLQTISETRPETSELFKT